MQITKDKKEIRMFPRPQRSLSGFSEVPAGGILSISEYLI